MIIYLCYFENSHLCSVVGYKSDCYELYRDKFTARRGDKIQGRFTLLPLCSADHTVADRGFSGIRSKRNIRYDPLRRVVDFVFRGRVACAKVTR